METQETVSSLRKRNVPSVTAGGDDGSGGRKPPKKILALSECKCEGADGLQTGQVLFCPVHSALVTRVSDSINLPIPFTSSTTGGAPRSERGR